MKVFRSCAPLRLGLAGGGTDVSPYCDNYGGFVLNATIDMYAHCSIIPTKDGVVTFEAKDKDEIETFFIDDKIDIHSGLELHKAVYSHIVKNFNGGIPLSHKLITFCDAPPGSGLGSSSAVVVSMVKAYCEWLNLPLGEYDIAMTSYVIERVELGQHGGRQDQYAAAFGGFNFMEFYADERVIVNPLRIKSTILREFEASLLLFYSSVSRLSSKIIEEQIDHIKKHEEGALDATHRLKDGAVKIKEHLLKGNLKGIADDLRKGWESKKKIANSISNESLEKAFEIALAAGATSGKVSGAGGGGFIMFIVDPLLKVKVARALGESDGKVMPFHFTKEGAYSWTGTCLDR